MVFFTFRDFTRDGGGSIRIKGILNALATQGKEIILISNSVNHDTFHKDIKHVNLNRTLSKTEKRLFQFLISFLPNFFMRSFFNGHLVYLKDFFYKNNIETDKIIFFESLDNTFGYFLKINNIIKNYVNDTHGITTLEFQYKDTNKFINTIKYKIARLHDKKVLSLSQAIIFVSAAMHNYFLENYSEELENKTIYIIRDGVNTQLCKEVVEHLLLKQIKDQYGINNKDKVVFFAGGFKNLGGVVDLVKAFNILKKQCNDAKLFLIGDGEELNNINDYIVNNNLDDVILAGLIPYNKLRTYQELADVIVCPDKWHPYSEIAPHIKYFDSLASGKVVINGRFKCIDEINQDEKLSINFEPSNIDNLSEKLLYVLNNLDILKLKYKNNQEYVCQNMTYKNILEESSLS